MKKLLILLILCAFIFTSCSTSAYGASTVSEEQTLNPAEVQAILDECISKMAAAHNMAEAARILGYAEEHLIIQLAKKEYEEAQDTYTLHHDFYSAWLQKVIEYPTAAYVWQYLKSQGFSDQVCAGILGNMVAECGGTTLNLHWDIYGGAYKEFYGLCQWHKTYYPEVHGTDLQTQCEFLINTMKTAMDYFGPSYRRGYDYEKFLEINNAYDAGIAFCEMYERGHGATIRGRYAIMVYEYFTDYELEEKE